MAIANRIPKNLLWLTKITENFVERSNEIEGFGFGKSDNINSQIKKYPYLWITPTTSDVIANTDKNGYSAIETDFEIRVGDILRGDLENDKEAISNVGEIVLTYLREVSFHPYYVDNHISVVGDVTIDYEYEENDAITNIAVMTITFRYPFSAKFCSDPVEDIPPYTFSSISNNTGTPEISVAITGSTTPDQFQSTTYTANLTGANGASTNPSDYTFHWYVVKNGIIQDYQKVSGLNTANLSFPSDGANQVQVYVVGNSISAFNSLDVEVTTVQQPQVTGLTGEVVNGDEIQWSWDSLGVNYDYILEINGTDYIEINQTSYRQTDTSFATSFEATVRGVFNDIEGQKSDSFTIDMNINLVQYLQRINRYDRAIFLHEFKEQNLNYDFSNNISKSNDVSGRSFDFEQLTASEQPSFISPNILSAYSSDNLENSGGANIFSTGYGTLVVSLGKITDGGSTNFFTLISGSDSYIFYITRGAGQSAGPTFYLQVRTFISGSLVNYSIFGYRSAISNAIGVPGNNEGFEVGTELKLAFTVDNHNRALIYVYGKTPSAGYNLGLLSTTNVDWVGERAPWTNPEYQIARGSGTDTNHYKGILAFDTANFSLPQLQKIMNLIGESEPSTAKNSLLKLLESISAIDNIVYACNFLDSSLIHAKDNDELIRPVDLSNNAFDFLQPDSLSTPITYNSNGIIMSETAFTQNQIGIFNELRNDNTLTLSDRGHLIFKDKISTPSFDDDSSNHLLFVWNTNTSNYRFQILTRQSSSGKYKIHLYTNDIFTGGTSARWRLEQELDYGTTYDFDLFWDLSDNPKMRINGVEYDNWTVISESISGAKPKWLGALIPRSNSFRTYHRWGLRRNNQELKGLVIVDTETQNLSVSESNQILNAIQ